MHFHRNTLGKQLDSNIVNKIVLFPSIVIILTKITVRSASFSRVWQALRTHAQGIRAGSIAWCYTISGYNYLRGVFLYVT